MGPGARPHCPTTKDPALPNSMTAVVSFLLLKIKKAAQNSTFFKAPRTKSPFPVIDPTLFIYLFCRARGAQRLPPNDLEPVEGLRASDPPPLGRAPGVGRGGSRFRPAPPPRSPNFSRSPQLPGGPGGGWQSRGAVGAGRGPTPAGRAAAPHSSLARAGCGREC